MALWIRQASSFGEGGASLVEFALVVVLLTMLLLGIVTGGLAYNRKITLTDAARVAARYGTTHAMPLSAPASNCADPSSPTTGVTEWLIDVACDAIANAQGELAEGTSGRAICVTYAPPGTDLSGAATLEWGVDNTGTVELGTSCPGATLSPSPTDAVVEVVVRRTANLDAVVWNHTLTLQADAFGRYEQVQPS